MTAVPDPRTPDAARGEVTIGPGCPEHRNGEPCAHPTNIQPDAPTHNSKAGSNLEQVGDGPTREGLSEEERAELSDLFERNHFTRLTAAVERIVAAHKAAALRDAARDEKRLCSQCGEQMSVMVKVGTQDGWCSACLDEAAEGPAVTRLAEVEGEVERLRGSDLVLRKQVAKQANIIGAVWDVINDYKGTSSRTARRLRREVRAALRGEAGEGRA
jgi:hypothetical protein